MINSPFTGVAALIVYDEKILIGERKEKNKICWQLPGGLINLGESPSNAVIREVKEETNLEIEKEQLVAITNNVFCASKHTISLIFKAKCKNPTKLLVREPDKCSSWVWVSWDNLPTPLFLPLQTLVEEGYHPLNSVNLKKHKNKTNNCFIF